MTYMRLGRSELTADERSILRHGYAVDDAEERATTPQTVTTSAGGYLIPSEFQAELIRAMKAFGAIRENATVFETDSGSQIAIPTVDDTSNKGRLISINTQVTTSDVSFGQTLFDAYKYSSDQVLVPIELMEDSAFDMDGLVNSILAERLGRITEEHYTTGDGSGKPKGIVAASAQGTQGTTG
jgi:HK97 family phage major capsid protein